ncbi:ABC transporter permease [Mesorhizobium sp. M0761]|uniref:ABC transporter permease n=1 Tax=unclassified Mesorhizobium TaxID=325217 RepID=UPI0003CF46F2|nr:MULTISPECIES: ABC transporter permease [unclassified Mesorhizobium]ESW89291.1 ABC transporter permease [Mesorhizobium sp. LSJC285A00]ESW89502.1 ABC transporter permease [Mesorhizobium sp. LSJC269B00]ESX17264.1 ABC transporter permease [Mesorhizobium sp. LSJC255A00]ESX32580.1 ABC transporter permease [Mesorhizobium sp. LSHC440B00]ESX38703.1 ABC transporter permease [Mesorhizobium sp. LSHC432A00]
MNTIGWPNVRSLNQEGIVFAIAVVLFVAAAIGLPGFIAANNLVAIVRSVSVLGILALGMAVVIIGRGIDLSAVAIMAMSVAWYLQLLNAGTPDGLAFAYVLAGVLAIGLLNGFLVAYADVPAIFVTLATGSFVFGYVRSQLITQDAVPVPQGHWVELLGGLRFLDIPIEVFVFAGLAFLFFLFLRYTKWGRYIYFAGDNPVAARNIGIPVRPMLVLRYVVSAFVALIAGLLTASSLHSINTRVVNSTLLYDIVLVAVIGGIGLSGGRGGVRNVLVGAALIGILSNAMTIIDIPLLYQNLIKAAILLGAIIVDGIINPRDEQTAQQGDI